MGVRNGTSVCDSPLQPTTGTGMHVSMWLHGSSKRRWRMRFSQSDSITATAFLMREER